MKYLTPTDLIKKGKNIFIEGDELVIISKKEMIGAMISSELYQALIDGSYINQARYDLKNKGNNTKANEEEDYSKYYAIPDATEIKETPKKVLDNPFTEDEE